jgi:hypothetical protein
MPYRRLTPLPVLRSAIAYGMTPSGLRYRRLKRPTRGKVASPAFGGVAGRGSPTAVMIGNSERSDLDPRPTLSGPRRGRD